MFIIKEGFQAGTANKVIQKVVNVVERKNGKINNCFNNSI